MAESKATYLTIDQEAYFPNLTRDKYAITSNPTPNYNCIAHAAGHDDCWWWPDDLAPNAHWPEGLEKTESMGAFVLAYGTKGYVECPGNDRSLESGFEKVAVFSDKDGIPTHAARQLSDGTWTSKLGEAEDIQHFTLEAMEGGDGQTLGYGTARLILKRPSG